MLGFAFRRLAAVMFGSLVLVGGALGAPPDVGASLRLHADGITIHWDEIATAEGYDVYRGTEANLSDLTCLRFRIPQTETTDDLFPPPGRLLTYVVAAWNANGEGPLGTGSHGAPRVPAVPCADDDGDGVRDDQDNCPGIDNPGQADQNENGLGDPCDVLTYTFEDDLPGLRPSDTTQIGGTDDTFAVRDFGGSRGVSYADPGGSAGVHDRFDRLTADLAQQGVDVYLDPVAGTGASLTLAAWNDGTRRERAGSAVELRVTDSGELLAHRRLGDARTLLGEASVTAGARLRARLRKLEGIASRLVVDEWSGSDWTEEVAVFDIDDDHRLIGRDVTLVSADGGALGTLRVSSSPLAPAGALSIVRTHQGLTDWKLYQRGPEDHASIPLPVVTRCQEPCRIEARLVDSQSGATLPGFDYADLSWLLPAAPDGGRLSDLTLADVPAGGNYDLEVRLLDEESGDPLGEEVVAALAVGDVFLAAGQSNMSGYSGVLEPAEPPVDQVHLFGNDYTWKRAREPMDDGTDQVDLVSAESPLHTLMLPFAKQVWSETGIPVAIIPAPLGGTNLYAQWQRNDALPEDRGTLYGSSVYRVNVQGYDHPIRGVIWYQGESDAGRGTDVYLADLQDLVERYREDLAAPGLFFGNCQLATHLYAFDLEGWIAIQEAQRRYAEIDPQSAVVALVDQPRSDTIHLNVPGYKEAGRRLGRAVLAGSYGLEQPLGPQVVSIRFASASRNRVVITYDKDVTGGAPYLYRVADGAVPVNVNAVTTSGRDVTLDLAASTAAGATVTYGYSRNPGVEWVLAADGSGTALAFRRLPIDPP